MKEKIVFIAPFPPPITGQSYASKILYENLKKEYDIIKINYGREDAINKSSFNFNFIKKIFYFGKILKKIKNKNKKYNNIKSIYFTISQSLLGNLKDLYFLFKIGRNLRKKTIIHLHGGYFDNYYKKSFILIKLLNKLMFKDIKKGIVLGESLIKCLLPIIDKSRIVIVNNFYQKELIFTEEQIKSKWQNIEKINFLFLSNLMIEKGYIELINAYKNLPDFIKQKIVLNFAGNFENEKNKIIFFEIIKDYNNIIYYGVVDGEQKKELLRKSLCFILPTYYHIEGQPISILEAYASGMFVITTNQGGISDIFKDKINGILIEKKSISSIEKSIIDFVENINYYKNTGINNYYYSKIFSEDKFIDNIKNLL